MHPVMRQLVRDHGMMLAILDAIDREVTIAEAGGPLDSELVVTALRCLHDVPEWHHHPLEEALFARAIGRDPGCQGAFSEVWAEHDRFPAATRRLLDWFDGGEGGGPEAPDLSGEEVLAELGRYAVEQRRHIERENDSVFLVLLAVLVDEDWEQGRSAVTTDAATVFRPILDHIQALQAAGRR